MNSQVPLLKTYSNFLDYVKPPLPQKFADDSTGIIPIGKHIFQGDETNFTHQGYGGYACPDCKSCKATCEHKLHYKIEKNMNPIEQIIADKENGQVRQQTFGWLMDHLIPVNNRFKGCELIFPDTVFFSKSKPVLVVKCDKDWCLNAIKSQNKKGQDNKNKFSLSLHNLTNMLSAVVRDRKRDQNSVFSQIYMKQMQVETISKLNNNGRNHNSTLKGKKADVSDEAQKAFNREQMIVRLWPDEESGEDNIQEDRVEDIEVVCHTDLEKYSYTYIDNWKRVRYIQTCVKTRTGIGKPIVIYYYAPMPTVKQGERHATIKYDFRGCGDDFSMIKDSDDYGYCIKQCVKMCFYIQKIHNIDILKMRCEFAKDDNGTIWFTYANQIYRRETPGFRNAQQNIQLLKYCNKQHQKLLQDEIEEHKQKQVDISLMIGDFSSMEDGNQNIMRLFNIMDEQYNHMKKQIGVEEALAGSAISETDAYIEAHKNARKLLKTNRTQSLNKQRSNLLKQSFNLIRKQSNFENEKTQTINSVQFYTQPASLPNFASDDCVEHGIGQEYSILQKHNIINQVFPLRASQPAAQRPRISFDINLQKIQKHQFSNSVPQLSQINEVGGGSDRPFTAGNIRIKSYGRGGAISSKQVSQPSTAVCTAREAPASLQTRMYARNNLTIEQTQSERQIRPETAYNKARLIGVLNKGGKLLDSLSTVEMGITPAQSQRRIGHFMTANNTRLNMQSNENLPQLSQSQTEDLFESVKLEIKAESKTKIDQIMKALEKGDHAKFDELIEKIDKRTHQTFDF